MTVIKIGMQSPAFILLTVWVLFLLIKSGWMNQFKLFTLKVMQKKKVQVGSFSRR